MVFPILDYTEHANLGIGCQFDWKAISGLQALTLSLPYLAEDSLTFVLILCDDSSLAEQRGAIQDKPRLIAIGRQHRETFTRMDTINDPLK